ncbi:DUF3253 domain-containing protein [Mycobacterium sp.]|uniref:DUF3253 domain-containing protein n=1 Tax=Mycobacterium sp. TaxID=1785 RepID=UPI003C76A8BF
MSTGGSDPHRELARVADSTDPAASAAQTALGGGPAASRLRAAILALARHRGPSSSICPSDAARAIGGDSWRELTAQSRSIAFALARDGDVEITQRGAVVDPDRPSRGPIRIRAKSTGRS